MLRITNALTVLILLTVCHAPVKANIYDYYSGKVVPPEYVVRYAHSEPFRDCTVMVNECEPHEGRRVDGSCNNVEWPTRAMQRSPFGRILPHYYGPNNTLASIAADGTPLPSAREVRTALQPSLRVVSKRFTMAMLHIAGFHSLETTRLNGAANYLVQKLDCCTPAGENDPKCMPIYVPKDDPYLGDKGIRCLNVTRAQTFQELRCITNDYPAETINNQTPLLDLSPIYGPNMTVHRGLRAYEKGLLKMEFRKKRYVPPGLAETCYANKKGEPCQQTGDATQTFQPKLMLFAIWFMRLHNLIASELSIINPCYFDEQLFQQAREINIALLQNIMYYEMYPALLGAANLLKVGLMSPEGDFMDTYNPHEIPRTLAEWNIGFRALHSLLDDAFGLYNNKAELVGVTSLNRWIQAVGVLENDNNMEEMSRSMFYQASGDSMRFSDPSLSNNIFVRFHKANDVFSIDIQRGRDLGMRSYNEYRKVCGLKYAHNFEDFLDVMDPENVKTLEHVYHTVNAVEFAAGVRAEREIKGATVGPTLFCIMTRQMRIWRDSDRFWFERKQGKHGLTKKQLEEVRLYSLARLACDTADGLNYIQPYAFLLPSIPKNPIVDCDKIRKLDLTKWRDKSCDLHPSRMVLG